MSVWMMGLVALVVAGGALGWLLLRDRGDRFAGLGDIRGQQLETLVRKIGKPTKRVDRPDGAELFWLEPASFNPGQLVVVIDTYGRVIRWNHARG